MYRMDLQTNQVGVCFIPDLCNSHEFVNEVELVSLVEEQIPKYKLRLDTITQFSGYENNDWYIKTPIINSEDPIDLSPDTISETLKYFVLSADRLSQMTKTYNDIEAVTKLLEEKERDLELAARIGQSLLEQNKVLKCRNEELENELSASNESVEKLKLEVISTSERVIQLKHEISLKNGLLQIYSADEAEESEFESPDQCLSENKTLLSNWEELHKKVGSLEEENSRLRIEATTRANDIELGERKELQLIQDIAKQLTEANVRLIKYQDEVSLKNEDNIRQQEEITNLVSQVVELQRKVRDLNVENEALQNALQTSHECQNELSLELIEIKEKYGTLLAAFHELQSEFKKRSRLSSSHYAFMPFSESLASEIESTLGSEEYESEMSGSFLKSKRRTGKEETRCYSPDSVLSGESFNYRYNNPHLMTGPSQRSYYFPDKLQIVKPIEGSATLRQWQKLATPHLGVILEKLPGVPNKAIKDLNTELLEFALNSSYKCMSENNCNINFITTSSIFTYTTTSLSQTTDSTRVTPSFSNVQLSTGLQLSVTTTSSIGQSSISTKVNYEDKTASDSCLLSTSKDGITNVISPVLSSCSTPLNGLNLGLSDNSLAHKSNVFVPNTKSSDQKASETNISSEKEFHLTVQQSVLSTSRVLAIENNPSNKNDGNKPSEDHSKAVNNTNEGLGGMSLLLNEESIDGIITKCYSPMHLSSKKLEKPNSLGLRNSKLIDYETRFKRGDVSVIKTLRKGGFV